MIEKIKLAVFIENTSDKNILLDIATHAGFIDSLDFFDTIQDFLFSYNKTPYDGILFDFSEDSSFSIETLKLIRKAGITIPAGFLADNRNNADLAYENRIIDYMLKPISNNDFLEFAHNILRYSQYQNNVYIQRKTIISAEYSSIMYIEQLRNSIVFHLNDGTELKIKDKLDSIYENFDTNLFYRCHQSYVVNLIYVKDFNSELNTFILEDGTHIHISRKNLSVAKKKLTAIKGCQFF